MRDLRAVVNPEDVLNLLSRYFKQPAVGMAPVDSGPMMRTFSFAIGKEEYLIRFNKDNMLTSNLPKEEYITRKLAPTRIPVRPIVQTGRLGELFFAISRKVPGKVAASMPAQEVKRLLPQIISTLDSIHHVDVSDTSGYGVFDLLGRGMSMSWRGFLELIAKEEDERDYFGKWHHLFDDTFLERNLYERIYDRMTSLLDYCPSERYLVHGSYSLYSILVDDGRITAVQDWFDARYGDFVYDIAGLDFWFPWLGVREAFQLYYKEREVEVPSYPERMLCYECYVALGGMRFFAFAGNEPSYRTARSLILQKLDSSAP